MRKIRMRNLKTALSVFLCIVILRFFNINYPFYACIAAVICMQSSIFDSFTTGKNKAITIGCIVFLGIMINLTDTTPLIYSTTRLLRRTPKLKSSN